MHSTELIASDAQPPKNPQQPEGIRVPHRYEVWSDGVYSVTPGTRDASIIPSVYVPLPRDAHPGRKQVTNRPLWIAAIGHTVDTNEPLVKLAFVALDGRFDSLWIDRGQITDTRGLAQLGALGIPIDGLSSRDVLVYLRDAELLLARTTVPVPVGSRSGPYLANGRWGFLLGRSWIGPGHLEPDPRRRSRQGDAYEPHGSWEEWRAKWLELYEYGWATRWLVACAFAAPLLRHLGCRTFIVHAWTPSGGGKTAACHFGMSVWGDPERLYGSQNTTQIAVTEVFKYLTDLPVLYDELQVATITPDELIYSVCLNAGRERGAKQGGQRQDRVSWNVLAYSTGEVPLVSRGDLGGQLNRVLQIHSQPFRAKADAEAIYHFTRLHYGHAGPLYLDALVRVLNMEGGIAHLRAMHATLRAEIVARTGQNGNHATYTAAIATAQMLSAVWLLGIDAAEAQRYAIDDAVQVIHETQPTQTLSYAERALAKLRDHWIANPGLYADDSGDLDVRQSERQIANMRYIVGVERPESMVYIPHEADRILLDGLNPLEPERVWRDFAANGWLILSSAGGLLTTAPLRGEKSPQHPVYAIDGRVFYTAPRLQLIRGGQQSA